MTSITFDAPSTRLRITPRGRRVLAAAAALPAAVVIGYAVLSGGAALASAGNGTGAATTSFETVVVQPGDSLWSIAEEVAPAADPRDVVDALVRLNALGGATLEAGDELAIPAEYADR